MTFLLMLTRGEKKERGEMQLRDELGLNQVCDI